MSRDAQRSPLSARSSRARNSRCCSKMARWSLRSTHCELSPQRLLPDDGGSLRLTESRPPVAPWRGGCMCKTMAPLDPFSLSCFDSLTRLMLHVQDHHYLWAQVNVYLPVFGSDDSLHFLHVSLQFLLQRLLDLILYVAINLRFCWLLETSYDETKIGKYFAKFSTI